MTPDESEAVAEAVKRGEVIVCYAKCWPCSFGDHFDPHRWHGWADLEDVEHAAKTGQSDPSSSRCGCWCAGKGERP